jgi:hypothetical protein
MPMDDYLTAEERQRRTFQEKINGNPATREELEIMYGKDNVWDTDQLREQFEVQGFAAPFCVVTRKKDGKRGALAFQHAPRFYFGFTES